MKLRIKRKIFGFYEKLLIGFISLLIGTVFVPEQEYLTEQLRDYLNMPQTSLIAGMLDIDRNNRRVD